MFRCYVCGLCIDKEMKHYPYCSEKCENVMKKSRGFMCPNEKCESTDIFSWVNKEGDHSSQGVLCNKCGELVVNNRLIRKGKR